MSVSSKKLLIEIMRIIPAAILGYFLSKLLKLTGISRVIFYFAVYLAVGILIELIRKMFKK